MAEKGGIDGKGGGCVKMEEEEESASEMFQVTAAASFSIDPGGGDLENGASSGKDATRTNTNTQANTAQLSSQPSNIELDPNVFNLPSSRGLPSQSSERTGYREAAPSLGNTTVDPDVWHGQDIQSSSISIMPRGGDSWDASEGVWVHLGDRNGADLGHRGKGAAEDRIRHNNTGGYGRTHSSEGGPWTSISADTDHDTGRDTGHGTGANGPKRDNLGGPEDIWGPVPAHTSATLPAPAFTPAVTSVPVSSRNNGLTWRGDEVEQWMQTSLSSTKSQPLPQRVTQQPSDTPRSQQQQHQQQHVPRRIPLKTAAVTAVRVSRAGGLPTPSMALPRLPPGMHRSPSISPSARSDCAMPPPSYSPATRKRLRSICPGETDIECGSRSEGTVSVGMCIDSEGIAKEEKWEQGQGRGQGQGQELGRSQWQAQGNRQEEGQWHEQGQGQWQGRGRGQGLADVRFPVPTRHVAGEPPSIKRPLRAAQNRDISESLWGGAAPDHTQNTVIVPGSFGYSGQITAHVPAPVPVHDSAAAVSGRVESPHSDPTDEEEW
jgi:hypothetical protein